LIAIKSVFDCEISASILTLPPVSSTKFDNLQGHL
jgi:hypothetical protein